MIKQWRRPQWVLFGFMLGLSIILLRAFDLQVIQQKFLQHQGDMRYERTLSIPARRGMLTDRNGELLAVSTPVESIWINPQQFNPQHEHCNDLAQLLGMSLGELISLVKRHENRQFVYLKRHLSPSSAQAFLALGVPGVFSEHDYQRYYPAAEIAAHVVGFTNIDGVGQEGLEKAFESTLKGTLGKRRVWKDLKGRVIETFEVSQQAHSGRDIQLSMDRRIQYFAYRELQNAVALHKPVSASVVVLDVWTGEVLAMVNYPTYNPNDRKQLKPAYFRNRAVTDVFEPGSTMKPFTVAAGLRSGKFKANVPIDTNPGYFYVGRLRVKDARNYGVLSLSKILQKSSNVGAAKIALTISPQQHWQLLSSLGFGVKGHSGFPGERSGSLPYYKSWGKVHRATLSYGYGLSVTPLQLAQAYTVLASDGRLRPVSLLKVNTIKPGKFVLTPQQAKQVRFMLEGVVSAKGTAKKAKVEGYRVAGKTGTAYKAVAGGYDHSRYISVFAGFAPVTQPKVAMVVVINEPQGKQRHGGDVAAPVFAKVMEGTLRLLNVPPDDISQSPIRLVGKG